MRPYMRNANVQWNRLDLSDVAEMHFDKDEVEKFMLKPGDVLACEGGRVVFANLRLGVTRFQVLVFRKHFIAFVRKITKVDLPEYLLLCVLGL